MNHFKNFSFGLQVMALLFLKKEKTQSNVRDKSRCTNVCQTRVWIWKLYAWHRQKPRRICSFVLLHRDKGYFFSIFFFVLVLKACRAYVFRFPTSSNETGRAPSPVAGVAVKRVLGVLGFFFVRHRRLRLGLLLLLLRRGRGQPRVVVNESDYFFHRDHGHYKA